MTSLLQVGLYRPDGSYVTSIAEMHAALAGSPYLLDEEQTLLNDDIAIVITPTEWEAQRLMEESGTEHGRWPLPSGYTMEVPTA